MNDVKSFQVGDLVWVRNYQNVEVPGLVTGSHTFGAQYGDEVTYDVDTIPAGVIAAGSLHMRPIGTPTPAAGQRWQCITRPDLVLAVDSVERGGLLASCTMPNGTPTGHPVRALRAG
jgi:hypothetical protein